MIKNFLLLSLLALLPLTATSQPIMTHHYDICGTVELAPDNIGRYFQTDLGYKFSFMQEIAFPIGTRLHIVGTTIDSCDIHQGISQCILFEEISKCDCPVQYGTCCVGYKGDINGDGSDILDISDLLFLIDYMFSLDPNPLPCLDEADFIADNSIDISDLLAIIDWMFLPHQDIFPPPTPPLCPVDTVIYRMADDTSLTPARYEFRYMPEGQLLVIDPYGYEYEGFYSGNSLIFYNWDFIDAQSITSCSECDDSMSCYDEVYTIAGPVYERLFFIKIQ